MSNAKVGNARANGRFIIDEHNEFLQEQLMESQQSLFFARSVKEAKFLQTRINFLKQRLNGVKRSK